jgi:hypothetical protein
MFVVDFDFVNPVNPVYLHLGSRGCFAPQRGQKISFLPTGWPHSWHLRSRVILIPHLS